MDRLSHGQQDVGTTPRREVEIRHHERQLCATELLILAERNDDTFLGGQLLLAAVAISRREVA